MTAAEARASMANHRDSIVAEVDRAPSPTSTAIERLRAMSFPTSTAARTEKAEHRVAVVTDRPEPRHPDLPEHQPWFTLLLDPLAVVTAEAGPVRT